MARVQDRQTLPKQTLNLLSRCSRANHRPRRRHVPESRTQTAGTTATRQRVPAPVPAGLSIISCLSHPGALVRHVDGQLILINVGININSSLQFFLPFYIIAFPRLRKTLSDFAGSWRHGNSCMSAPRCPMANRKIRDHHSFLRDY